MGRHLAHQQYHLHHHPSRIHLQDHPRQYLNTGMDHKERHQLYLNSRLHRYLHLHSLVYYLCLYLLAYHVCSADHSDKRSHPHLNNHRYRHLNQHYLLYHPHRYPTTPVGHLGRHPLGLRCHHRLYLGLYNLEYHPDQYRLIRSLHLGDLIRSRSRLDLPDHHHHRLGRHYYLYHPYRYRSIPLCLMGSRPHCLCSHHYRHPHQRSLGFYPCRCLLNHHIILHIYHQTATVFVWITGVTYTITV